MADDDEVTRGLDAGQREKVWQLRDLTGVDGARCRAMLEGKAWDLEAAGREQVEIMARRVRAPPRATDIRVFGSRFVPGQKEGEEEESAAVMLRLCGSLLGWGLYLSTLPITFPFRVARTAYCVTSYVLEASAAPSGASRASSSPVQDVRRFVEEFSAVAGVPEGGGRQPNFQPVSYSQVLEEARRDLRFLLVYLHSPGRQDTGGFCRQTLCSDHLLTYLDSQEVLMWGCSVESREGVRVSRAMGDGALVYPFLALMVLRENRMTMVGSMEGRIEAEELTDRLRETVDGNRGHLETARREREERSLARAVRAEQDAAFQEALRRDQERERRRRQAEEEERRYRREEQERKEKILQMKVDLVGQIAEEPDPSHPEALRILIKLPDGQRLERWFLRTQSLKYLYYFVFCHPDSPDVLNITTNFPKKVLRCKPEEDPASFAEEGIQQCTTLFVHDLEA